MFTANLFNDIPTELPRELFETIHESAQVKIERIVSHGHRSPDGFWYDQELNEWVMVLQGAARIEFADGQEAIEMTTGDHLLITAHQKHRVACTTADEPTIWLAVHFV